MTDIPIPDDRFALAGTIGGLVVAFRHTLVTLATEHNNSSGEWLDDLQRLIDLEIKSTSSDNTSYEGQTTYVTAALAVVSGLFSDVREKLERLPP
jgi:hypothetical protein